MKEAKEVKMPSMDLAVVQKEAAVNTKDAVGVLDMIKRTTIKTVTEYATGANWLAEIKQKRDKVDAARKSVVDPLNAVIKIVNGWLMPGIKALDDAERALKMKMVIYQQETTEKRDKLINAAGKASNQKERERLLEKAEERAAPEVGGVATRTTWTGEVVDSKKIPREFLTPDVKALLAFTRAKGGDPEIPGWRAFPNTTLAVSVDKVKAQ
jgi:hypothetical protein